MIKESEKMTMGPLPAVVLGAVDLDVAVAEPVAGLVGLVAAVDAKKYEKKYCLNQILRVLL